VCMQMIGNCDGAAFCIYLLGPDRSSLLSRIVRGIGRDDHRHMQRQTAGMCTKYHDQGLQ
jgi:hypothetical protein